MLKLGAVIGAIVASLSCVAAGQEQDALKVEAGPETKCSSPIEANKIDQSAAKDQLLIVCSDSDSVQTSDTEGRGQSEIDEIKKNLQIESGQVPGQVLEVEKAELENAIDQEQQRQQDASDEDKPPSVIDDADDKSAKAPAEIVLEVAEPISDEQVATKAVPITVYTSLRFNNSWIDGTSKASDGGTRVGAFYTQSLVNDWSFDASVEAGVNLFGPLSSLLTPDAGTGNEDKDIEWFERLYNVSFENNLYGVTAGKAWSLYHSVAGMTDEFVVFGGRASGIYNANTDGGAAGTGRADKALIAGRKRGNWYYGGQFQGENKIPYLEDGSRYDGNWALAAGYNFDSGMTLASAYNVAQVDAPSAEMQRRGIAEDTQALAVSARFTAPSLIDRPLRIALTFSQSQNLEADTSGQYFDARGAELFVQQRLTKRSRLQLGGNWLSPDDQAYQGLYHLEEYYLGYNYSLNQRDFNDMVFIHYKFNRSRSYRGDALNDVVLLGVHYRLQW